jgi:hypothetical protein
LGDAEEAPREITLFELDDLEQREALSQPLH